MDAGTYDVVVIGGGPAGLMVGVAAARAGARTLLVEKGDRLGRKLVISGGGRCNVTNAGEVEDIIRMIVGNGRFMHEIFHQFSNRDIIRFFEGLGVALKEEDHGRMFPATDKSTTVAETLIRHLRELGADIWLNTPVERVLYEEGRVTGLKLRDGRKIRTGQVVVAVGGMSVPKTGSTGDGYAWARDAGHTITPLYPTEVPLTLDEPWIRDKRLQGLSLRDVPLTLTNAKGKKLSTQTGDMVFTHLGVSGPAALRLGHYVSVGHARQEGPLALAVDLRPDRHEDEVVQDVLRACAEHPKRAIKNVLAGYLPERALMLVLALAGLDPELTHAHLPRAGVQALARHVKRLSARVTGTLSIEEAFVTGGGVSLKEVDAKTLESRKAAGLAFAGEVLDVHAHTGGYNITIALSTGWVAGSWAAKRALTARFAPEGAHP
jgi:predicted Rossmann fold flavoprotein